MLTHTFCHVPGLGVKIEAKLWREGVHTWSDALGAERLPMPVEKGKRLCARLEESERHREDGDAWYFEQRLSATDSWRLYSEFRHSAAYVDIETAGGYRGQQHITTIALWDGSEARHYVHGRNLEQFLDDILQYKMLVTFSGRCFDAPVLEKHFGVKFSMAHLDLRFALKAAGVTGGLKKVEKKFGLDRGALDGVDGYWAVLLWQEFAKTKNEGALETLLAYNMDDVLSLEVLAAHAHNLLSAQTPFGGALEMPVPQLGVNPFTPDPAVLSTIAHRIARRTGG